MNMCENDFCRVKITRTSEITFTVDAASDAKAKQEALIKLALRGWVGVDDEGLVLEVERVYETRWDCIIKPVERQAA